MVNGEIAVIGTGSIGRRHAENLRSLGIPVNHLAWRSFEPDTLSRRPHLKAVVIATATQVRLELIRLCVALDLPFYVEKPLSWSLHEVEAIHEAATPVAERSMVGYMMRYHPALIAIAAEDLSDIYNVTLEIGHDVRQWRENWRFTDSYAAATEGGGVLLDLSHEVDMAMTLFPALSVRSCECLGHRRFPGVDFATSLQLAAPGGPVCHVSVDYLSAVPFRNLRLRGQNRSWSVDFLKPELVCTDPDGCRTTGYHFERNDMFLAAMRDFLHLIDGTGVNPLAPRLDRMLPLNRTVAEAWSLRKFNGTIEMDLD